MRILRHALFAKLILVIVSLLLAVGVLEVIVFRYILVAPELPSNTFVNGVIKMSPNQRSGPRHPGPPFQINAQGWNSGHPVYVKSRSSRLSRIAIVGDSYVYASGVAFDKSLAEVLETTLGADEFEVYRFGMSAAPLSQYLQMLRQEIIDYTPDLAIFVLIHNDFDESYNIHLGAYADAFFRLDMTGDEIQEIPPKPFQRPWYWPLRASATYRYLIDTLHINIDTIKVLVNAQRFRQQYQANIDTSDMDTRANYDEKATRYLLAALKREAMGHNVRILLIMDGDRQRIYQEVGSTSPNASGPLKLNAMVQRLASELDVPFIDLHPLFEADYRANQRHFNPQRDGHWNEYGHAFVASVLFQYIATHGPFAPEANVKQSPSAASATVRVP